MPVFQWKYASFWSQGLRVKRKSENKLFPFRCPVEKCALALFHEMKRNACDVTALILSMFQTKQIPVALVPSDPCPLRELFLTYCVTINNDTVNPPLIMGAYAFHTKYLDTSTTFKMCILMHKK